MLNKTYELSRDIQKENSRGGSGEVPRNRSRAQVILGEKRMRIRKCTSMAQKRFKFIENNVEFIMRRLTIDDFVLMP